jgi:hypothetical protein
MKRRKFQDVPLRTGFRHGGQRYFKLGKNIARNERQKRTVFPSDMMVELLQDALKESRVPKNSTTKPVDQSD